MLAGNQKSEDRSERTEARGQKREDRSERTEARGQKREDRLLFAKKSTKQKTKRRGWPSLFSQQSGLSSLFSKKKDLGGSPEVLFLSMKENTINKTRDRARN
jgi:hypothetical protein